MAPTWRQSNSSGQNVWSGLLLPPLELPFPRRPEGASNPSATSPSRGLLSCWKPRATRGRSYSSGSPAPSGGGRPSGAGAKAGVLSGRYVCRTVGAEQMAGRAIASGVARMGRAALARAPMTCGWGQRCGPRPPPDACSRCVRPSPWPEECVRVRGGQECASEAGEGRAGPGLVQGRGLDSSCALGLTWTAAYALPYCTTHSLNAACGSACGGWIA